MSTDAIAAQGSLDRGVSRQTVFVCCACGKRSHDRYGDRAIDRGWDESCVLNSVEAYEDALVLAAGRVVEIKDGGIVPANAKGVGLAGIIGESHTTDGLCPDD